MQYAKYPPSRVYQGVHNYFRQHLDSPSGNISVNVINFNPNVIQPKIVGNENITPYFGHTWDASTDTNLDISVLVPSGNATFTLNFSSPEGAWNFDYSIPIYPNPLLNNPPPPPPPPPPPAPPASGSTLDFSKVANQWKSNISHYYTAGIGDMYEDGPWYYDMMRVTYEWPYPDQKLRDLGKQCGYNYVNYTRNGTAGTAGYEMFSRGLGYLYLDCLKQGDASGAQTFLSTLVNMSNHAQWGSGTYIGYNMPVSVTRETSYCLEMQNTFYSLNMPAPRLGEYAGINIYQLDTMFVAKTVQTNIVPFMAALACEALIEYNDLVGDQRVPFYVKATADWLIQNAYTPEEESFVYIWNAPPGSSVKNYDPVLNLLIVPVLGYAYKITGDNNYKNLGNKIFASGIAYADLDIGKQLTQNYRWSHKYLEWTGQLPSGY